MLQYSLVDTDGYICIHQSKRVECCNHGGFTACVDSQKSRTPATTASRSCRAGGWYEPWIFPRSGHCSETATNTHVSTYFHYSLGAPVNSTNIRSGILCQNHDNSSLKMPVCPRLPYTESMLINFIQMSLYNIFAMQAISYQFISDVAACKS